MSKKNQIINVDISIIDQLNERKKRFPFSTSSLAFNFSLDTWDWKEGLLLLVGVEPIGAHVEWDGYLNFMNVLIDEPFIINASFLDLREPDYMTPSSFEYEGDPDYFSNDESVQRKVFALASSNASLSILSKVWKASAIPHPERNAPDYYVRWALATGYTPPWLNWAIEQKLFDADKVQPQEEPKQNRREQQLEMILAVIAAMNFDPMQIPVGGKAKIEKVCLTRNRIFTSSGFEHAWKIGVGEGKFRMEKHENYSPLK